MKRNEDKNWINGCSEEFSRLEQGHKKDDTKRTNKLFLLIQNSFQGTRNWPIFVSVPMFEHQSKILTVYNSASLEIQLITKEKPTHQLLILPHPSSFSTSSFPQMVLVSFALIYQTLSHNTLHQKIRLWTCLDPWVDHPRKYHWGI